MPKVHKTSCAGLALFAGVLAGSIVLSTAIAQTPQAQEKAAAPGAEAARHHAPHHAAAGQGIEDRVKLLTKELDLDVKQQAQLRKLLEAQREQVMKVWADTTLAAANRVAATRAISDGTADQIRAMLNEEQKKKYNLAKPPRDAAGGAARPDVEDWMNPAKPKQRKNEDQHVEIR